MSINLTNAALLVRDDIVTVGVNIREENGGLTQKEYTYIADKETAANLHVGALVVAQARGKLTFAVVSRVDPELDIDPTFHVDYKWIVCVVPEERVAHNEWKTEEIVDKLKTKQRASVRRAALAELGVNPEELGNLLK